MLGLLAILPNRSMAEAKESGIHPKEIENRIIVYIRPDGRYVDEKFELLKDEEAIKAYVEKLRVFYEKEGVKDVEPVLHIRADSKESLKKHKDLVIRAAAEAGVAEVVTAVYITDR